MKKIGLILVLVLISVMLAAVSASAAPGMEKVESVGPYEGLFFGTVHGDKDSHAPIALELTHRGDQVEGVVYIWDGLYVDGGMCGGVNIPEGGQHANGRTLQGNPRVLDTSLVFDVSGFEVAVNLEGEISTDGNAITAEANIDLPWLCGRDPKLSGTLYRVEK